MQDLRARVRFNNFRKERSEGSLAPRAWQGIGIRDAASFRLFKHFHYGRAFQNEGNKHKSSISNGEDEEDPIHF